MRFDYQARLKRMLDAADVDVVAFVPGANMIYFTGLHFHLSERPIIAFASRDGLAFIIPLLEQIKVDQRPDLTARSFIWGDTEGYKGAFAEAVRELKLDQKRVGVDGRTMRVFEWLALQEAGLPTTNLTDVRLVLENLRAIKTAEEVAAIRKAIQISEDALRRTLAATRPGMSEVAIASRLNDEMSAGGSQGNAFMPIVLTGPKSALPHGGPDERTLSADEFLLIDFGGLYQEYPADITRTFCLGTPSDEMRRIYEAVYQANAAARAAAGPGVTCGAVDKAARDVIEAAGYGRYFTHRTGHGLGLEGHELPQIASGVSEVLQPGMVFTIEPGIYIPEIGGVRIEDVVHVTETGIETLTSFPRELA